MSARPILSDFERGLIVGARLAGASLTKTAGIAEVSRATASKVMTAWKSEGKTSSAKKNCGRKRVLTDQDVRKLIECVNQNGQATVSKLTASVNVGRKHPVSSKTVRRELHRAGYRSQVVAQKSLGTSGEKEQAPHSLGETASSLVLMGGQTE